MAISILSAVTTDADYGQFSDLIYQAFAGFGMPPERTTAWLDLVGRANLRAVRQDGRLIAGLGKLPFGQWFGGHSVPSAGVTTVAVLPEARGAGVGSAMMRDFIRELHREGTSLSVLYPSTKALYRKAGYEPAGFRFSYRLEASQIGPVQRNGLEIRAITEEHLPAVKAIYEGMARRGAGRLDRREPQWIRITRHGTDRVYAYGVFAGPQLEGYIYYSQHCEQVGAYEIRIRDIGAGSQAGWQRLLALLGDHVFMAGPITYQGGPVDPLIRAAREERIQIEHRHVWMLRIVDVAAALAARGYGAAISAELTLEIEDDLIAENCGGFTLTIADGRARVGKCSGAPLKLNIRGLASLYSGHQTTFELQSLGLADGPERDLELASTIFAGPPPAMSDRF